MKIAPVSADLLIKLAIGAVAVGAAYYLFVKAKDGVTNIFSSVGDTASRWADTIGEWSGEAVTAVNPASQDNLINKGVSTIGATVSGDDSWTLGGWIYDITHPDPGVQQQHPQPWQGYAGRYYRPPSNAEILKRGRVIGGL